MGALRLHSQLLSDQATAFVLKVDSNTYLGNRPPGLSTITCAHKGVSTWLDPTHSWGEALFLVMVPPSPESWSVPGMPLAIAKHVRFLGEAAVNTSMSPHPPNCALLWCRMELTGLHPTHMLLRGTTVIDEHRWGPGLRA